MLTNYGEIRILNEREGRKIVVTVKKKFWFSRSIDCQRD